MTREELLEAIDKSEAEYYTFNRWRYHGEDGDCHCLMGQVALDLTGANEETATQVAKALKMERSLVNIIARRYDMAVEDWLGPVKSEEVSRIPAEQAKMFGKRVVNEVFTHFERSPHE